MQFFPNSRPPVGTIFDCDMGRGASAAATLGTLYGLDGKNETRVVSISTSVNNVKSAALCDAIGRFYAGAVNGGFAAFARTLPTGMSVISKPLPDAQLFTALLEKKNAEGKPVYATEIRKLNDTADVMALIRNALTAQHDGNGQLLLDGPATNLAQLLSLPGVLPVIKAKAKELFITAARCTADAASARKLLAEWPTPITAVQAKAEDGAVISAETLQTGFAWNPNHPVVEILQAELAARKTAPGKPATGKPATAADYVAAPGAAAALFALRPKLEFWQISEPGVLSLDAKGALVFRKPAAGQTGAHRLVTVKPGSAALLEAEIKALITAPPVVRTRPRRRPDPEAEKKAAEQKAAEQKAAEQKNNPEKKP